MDNNEELVQISKYLPEVKDRYYINRKGELFTDNGMKRMEDGVKNGYVKNELNNNIENLEWCTNQENRIHAVKIGLAAHLVGEDNPASKLKEEQVLDIIQDLLHHVPYSEIIRKYDCSKSTISAIKNKRNWTYLTKDINFNDYLEREQVVSD